MVVLVVSTASLLSFRTVAKTVCHKIKMSSNSKEPLEVSGKVKKRAKTSKVVEDIKKNPIQAIVSPYFSPRKTRNKIKIEYENSKKDENSVKTTFENVKEEIADSSSSVQVDEKPNKSSKPTKRPQKNKILPEDVKDIKKEKWEPDNWRVVLENLKIMRKSVPAPVDTMGCDQCSDEIDDEKTQRFHKLLALMLSSQTKDQVTFDAMNRLKTRGKLTPESIIDWKVGDLEDTLKPVSFYKNKAKYIQKTAQILIDNYNSDIPDSLEGLMKLPGVGPKMAHICMNSAWNIISGIGVDVHVHRICNRLKWLRKPTKQPEETRVELESWLPPEHWSEVNGILVGFGQTICSPLSPKCGICLNNQICPSAFMSTKKSRKS